MESKPVTLKLSLMESISFRWVNGWQLLDASGEDLVQPWFRRKREALDFAKSKGWTVTNANAYPHNR